MTPLDASADLRRLLLVLLLVGLTSVAVDLVLLAHYETGWMLSPFAAVAIGLVCAIARLTRPTTRTVGVLRGGMFVLLATGLLGLVMHYRAGLEFQVDMDPTLSRWAHFWKVVRMKAPPALAPGALLQLSLLGLAATYRDPLVSRHPDTPSAGEHS